MQIIYKYLATDKEDLTTRLSPYSVNHTLYPSLFVADISKLAEWKLDGTIWN